MTQEQFKVAHGISKRMMRNRSMCKKRGYDPEDVYQLCMLAATKAARRFDVARGCKWSTYAYTTILGAFMSKFSSVYHTRGRSISRPDRWVNVGDMVHNPGQTDEDILSLHAAGSELDMERAIDVRRMVDGLRHTMKTDFDRLLAIPPRGERVAPCERHLRKSLLRRALTCIPTNYVTYRLGV